MIGGAFTNVDGMPRSYLARVFAHLPQTELPTILVVPADVEELEGEEIRLSVSANGNALTYQWRFGENDIAGATNMTLILPNVRSTQSGDYSVVVRNALGQLETGPARVTIRSFASVLDCPELDVTSQWGTFAFTASAPLAVTVPGTGWTRTTNETHDGRAVLAAKHLEATMALDEGWYSDPSLPVSLLQTTVAGPGRVGFWWRHGGTNAFAFEVAGVLMVDLTAATTPEWRHAEVPIPAGTHTLSWWAADDWVGEGNFLYLDGVTYTPGGSETIGSWVEIRQSAETGFHAVARVPTNAMFDVQFSTNLVDWTYVARLLKARNGTIQFADPEGTDLPGCFYRLSPFRSVFYRLGLGDAAH